jgi:hypothetical protein
MKCYQSKDSKQKLGKQRVSMSASAIREGVQPVAEWEMSAGIIITIPKGMPLSVGTLSGGTLGISIANARGATASNQEIYIITHSILNKNTGRVFYRNLTNSIKPLKNGREKKSKKLSTNTPVLQKNWGKFREEM